MSNPAKRKGTAWESDIVRFLKATGWPHAERRTLSGSHDRGDIAGIPGVVIEAKNVKTVALGTFVDEACVEAVNDGAAYGVAWIKRRGRIWPGDGFVVMTGWAFTSLLTEAGYGGGFDTEDEARWLPPATDEDVS